MRRSGLLRASSGRAICRLCACRIPQEGPTIPPRTGFHSTATPAQEQGSDYGRSVDASGWDLPDEVSEARNALLQMRQARQERDAAEAKRKQELADALEAQKLFGDRRGSAKRRTQEQTPRADQTQRPQQAPVQRAEPARGPQEPRPVEVEQTPPSQSQTPGAEREGQSQQAQQQWQLRRIQQPPASTPGNSLNRVQASKREARSKSPRLHRKKMQDQIMAAVQQNANSETLPTVQRPSWMQAAPASESREQPSSGPTASSEPQQFAQEDQDADLFEAEFDVTRQALAQSQAEAGKSLREKKPEPTSQAYRPFAASEDPPRQPARGRRREDSAAFSGSLRFRFDRTASGADSPIAPDQAETHSTQTSQSQPGHSRGRNQTTSRSLDLQQSQSSQLKIPPGSNSESQNPFTQLASALKDERRKPTPSSSAPLPDAGDLNEEEERLLQALLARRNKAPAATDLQPAPSQPVQPEPARRQQPVRWTPLQSSPAKPPPDSAEFSSIFEDLDEVARGTLASASRKHTGAEPAQNDEEERLRRDNDDKPRFKISFGNGTPWQDEKLDRFDPSSDWKHLRSRDQNRKQQDSRDPRPPPLSAEGIDARFEEHRRRRPRYGMFDINNVGYENPDYAARRRPDQTCVRCGMPGHFFANCPNPPKPGWVDRSGRNNRDAAQSSRNLAQESRDTRQGQSFTQPLRIREDEADEAGLNETQDAAALEALGKERARNARRSARFAEEDEEGVEEVKPAVKARRSRFEEEDEDDRPRRGRRGRFDEEDEFQADLGGVREARAERKRARQAKKDKAAKEAARQAARRARKAEEMTPITLPDYVTVSKLAQALSVRYEDFVEKMRELGFENTAHDEVITSENAGLIAMEYNFDATMGSAEEAEAEERDLKPRPEPEDKEFLPTRPPVVAIMGHVDHGKTTILDFLRKSSIAATEHGGITQHIGAFSVGLSSGKTITFLDTPGHAAFLEMRKRGATVTDIIILVVAADDSVKPQTVEAIKHAQAANVPIIVAVNKIDKEEANVERVKQDLARYGVEIEDFGGDTQVVPVSGKTGQGIDELEDAAVTLSEILDHRADTEGPVEGWVLEATTKKAGRVATVLVRRGTLKPGSIVVAGKTWARVRTLRNEAGVAEMSAGPGTPIEVDGWRDQPSAGDEVLQAPNEQKASDVVEYRSELEERIKMADDMEKINVQRRADQEKRAQDKEAAAAAASKAAAEDEDGGAPKEKRVRPLPDTTSAESLGHQTVPFIVKADVSGSVEAVTAYLLQMSNPLCSPTVLRAGVGPVSEFDIEHAAAAGGHIISFNLPPDPDSMGRAARAGIKLLEQNVIYRIVDDVKAVLEEKLPAVRTQRVTGEADVAMAFEIGVGGRKKLRIAGLKVRNGVVGRGSRVRVTRGDVKVYDGTVTSLKNVKKDVQEMRKGTECGMGFDGWEDFEVGDTIQTFEEKSEKRTLQI